MSRRPGARLAAALFAVLGLAWFALAAAAIAGQPAPLWVTIPLAGVSLGLLAGTRPTWWPP